MSDISFVDTTLRDGQQSLWALNMKTDAMLGAAERMDQAGFESLEFFSPNMIKKYVGEHKENPWRWIREGSKKFRKTKLRLHGGIHGGGAFAKLPGAIQKLLVERIVSYGITLTRTSNCWNDFRAFKEELHELCQLGMEAVVNLIYSVSPHHTGDYYARKAKEAAEIGPYRVCFKDVGGLLTPERARAFLPVIIKNAGDTPVEFHAHCNNSLAPLCYIEAAKLGIKTIHTSIPPLANGSSQPSIFNMAKNLRACGFEPRIDEAPLRSVTEHFTAAAHRDGLAIGRPNAYDHSEYLHQVPGGMISNLRHQLRLVGMEDKLSATLEETARVRAEFGYPIMVTPLSQFVGTQAAINVITGERYKEVTDQVIQYALGVWGAEATRIMDANVKDKILGRSRAKEWQNWQPPQPSLNEIRNRLGGPSLSDEELILRVYAGGDAVNALTSAGAPKPKLDAKRSLLQLIEELSRRTDYRCVQVRRGGVSLTLGRR
jgi:oxaloacetate decarboxylase alpha subunit